MSNDVRYDTAQMEVYAANLITFWKELRRGGMDRTEALAAVLELIRTIAVSNNKAAE
jgi:hypothetical protein